MAVNKVEMADGEVLIDLTNDTVTENDVLEGVSFHSADGETKTGAVVSAPLIDNFVTNQPGIGAADAHTVYQLNSNLGNLQFNFDETTQSPQWKKAGADTWNFFSGKSNVYTCEYSANTANTFTSGKHRLWVSAPSNVDTSLIRERPFFWDDIDFSYDPAMKDGYPYYTRVPLPLFQNLNPSKAYILNITSQNHYSNDTRAIRYLIATDGDMSVLFSKGGLPGLYKNKIEQYGANTYFYTLKFINATYIAPSISAWISGAEQAMETMILSEEDAVTHF